MYTVILCTKLYTTIISKHRNRLVPIKQKSFRIGFNTFYKGVMKVIKCSTWFRIFNQSLNVNTTNYRSTTKKSEILFYSKF